MTVVAVRRLPRGLAYKDSTDLVRDHTEVMRIYTDDNLMRGYSVGQSLLVPQLWNAHPEHAGSLLRSRDFTKEHKFTWIGKFQYSTETEDETDNTNDPNDPSIRVSYGTEYSKKVIYRDASGDAILNTIGFYPEKPVEIPYAKDVLKVSRNELTFSGATSRAYKNKVNSAVFTGAPIGTVYCKDVTADLQYKQGTFFYRVSYEFVYDPEGWEEVLLNESRIVYRTGGTYGRPVDDDGRDVNYPVPINTAGEQIASGSLPGGAVFLDFDVYNSVDFNALSLGV